MATKSSSHHRFVVKLSSFCLIVSIISLSRSLHSWSGSENGDEMLLGRSKFGQETPYWTELQRRYNAMLSDRDSPGGPSLFPGNSVDTNSPTGVSPSSSFMPTAIELNDRPGFFSPNIHESDHAFQWIAGKRFLSGRVHQGRSRPKAFLEVGDKSRPKEKFDTQEQGPNILYGGAGSSPISWRDISRIHSELPKIQYDHSQAVLENKVLSKELSLVEHDSQNAKTNPYIPTEQLVPLSAPVTSSPVSEPIAEYEIQPSMTVPNSAMERPGNNREVSGGQPFYMNDRHHGAISSTSRAPLISNVDRFGWKDIIDMKNVVDSMEKQLKTTQAENARLRKQVTIMHESRSIPWANEHGPSIKLKSHVRDSTQEFDRHGGAWRIENAVQKPILHNKLDRSNFEGGEMKLRAVQRISKKKVLENVAFAADTVSDTSRRRVHAEGIDNAPMLISQSKERHRSADSIQPVKMKVAFRSNKLSESEPVRIVMNNGKDRMQMQETPSRASEQGDGDSHPHSHQTGPVHPASKPMPSKSAQEFRRSSAKVKEQVVRALAADEEASLQADTDAIFGDTKPVDEQGSTVGFDRLHSLELSVLQDLHQPSRAARRATAELARQAEARHLQGPAVQGLQASAGAHIYTRGMAREDERLRVQQHPVHESILEAEQAASTKRPKEQVRVEEQGAGAVATSRSSARGGPSQLKALSRSRAQEQGAAAVAASRHDESRRSGPRGVTTVAATRSDPRRRAPTGLGELHAARAQHTTHPLQLSQPATKPSQAVQASTESDELQHRTGHIAASSTALKAALERLRRKIRLGDIKRRALEFVEALDSIPTRAVPSSAAGERRSDSAAADQGSKSADGTDQGGSTADTSAFRV